MFGSSARRGLSRIACAALALGVFGTAAPAVHAGFIAVDDFSETNLAWPASVTAVQTDSFDETGLNVLGGSRHTTVGAQSLAIPGLDSVTIAIFTPAPGVFDYASSAGADGDFSLLYDGPAGDLNADLSSVSAFQIEFALFDFGNGQPMPVTITLDDGANLATRTEFLNTSGGQVLSMPFAGFTGIGSLDLTSVNSILIEFDPGLGNDVRIGAITLVPAPAAGLVLLAGAGLLGARRRQRRV